MEKAFLITTLVFVWAQATFVTDFDILDSSGDKELVFYNFIIRDSYFFRSYNTTSFCKCRNACKVTPLCQTVSMNMDRKQRIDCRISAYQIYSLTMDPHKGAFTYAKAKGWIHWFGMDGMFYMVSSRLATLEQQRRYCRTFTSGRLLALKTKVQLQSFQKFVIEKFWDGISFIVDLEEQKGNDLLWGDGTKFDDEDLVDLLDPRDILSPENGVYMAILRGDDVRIRKETSNLSWPACQLNPFSRI